MRKDLCRDIPNRPSGWRVFCCRVACARFGLFSTPSQPRRSFAFSSAGFFTLPLESQQHRILIQQEQRVTPPLASSFQPPRIISPKFVASLLDAPRGTGLPRNATKERDISCCLYSAERIKGCQGKGATFFSCFFFLLNARSCLFPCLRYSQITAWELLKLRPKNKDLEFR